MAANLVRAWQPARATGTSQVGAQVADADGWVVQNLSPVEMSWNRFMDTQGRWSQPTRD
jgi:hypothetical protein